MEERRTVFVPLSIKIKSNFIVISSFGFSCPLCKVMVLCSFGKITFFTFQYSLAWRGERISPDKMLFTLREITDICRFLFSLQQILDDHRWLLSSRFDGL